MKCKYCYANFNHLRPPLSKKDWFSIIQLLAESDFKKINFVGGEPTLCPFLGELIVYPKNIGFITSVVSNGTGITQKFIEEYGNFIDWIGLSLDSGKEYIQRSLFRRNGNYVQSIIDKSNIIKDAGIRLKINSVITRLNYRENLSNLIKEIEPDRWKVFQVLEIQNINSGSVHDLLISQEEFEQFVKRHENLNPIFEENEAMIEFYIMIDPH